MISAQLKPVRRPPWPHSVLTVVFCGFWLCVCPQLAHPEDSTDLRPWYVGGDVSALPLREKMGAVYRNSRGQPEDALHILRQYGANCFRIRLFVAPNGEDHVVNDLAYTLKLARRVKAAGAYLLLDLHYSDTWADPGRQEVPAAWRGLTGDALAAQVEQYTFETIKAFVSADVSPTMVQIGNEIDNGMLTTHNKIWTDDPAGWKEFARLFQAGVRGVRRAQPPDQPIQVIFHSASGGLVERSRALMDKLVEHGFEYDIHGLSYYPWWHGKLKGLQENIRQIITDLDKHVMLVEVAYPWKTPHPKSRLWNGVDEWETTPAGQAAYLRDVSRTVFTAPDGRGLGVLWWFPESTPVGEQPTWNGGETALFTPAGNPLLAASIFQEFRRSGPILPTQPDGDAP